MTNLLTGDNATFTLTLGSWSGTTSTQTWLASGGRTDPGVLKITAGGTGTRAASSPIVAATGGQQMSVGTWLKWLTGATPRACAVDIQWMTGAVVQTTVNGTTITPGTGAYSQAVNIASTAPTGVGIDGVRIRVRLVAAVATDEVLVDDAQINTGSSLDSNVAPVYSLWDGTNEIPIQSITLWDGTTEKAASPGFV